MSDAPQIPVYLPSLVVVLYNKEKTKGKPLSKAEVESICAAAKPVMMTPDRIEKLKRGYEDINPANAFAEWSRIRLNL